jgi:uncharacterized membrane protein
MKKALEYSKAIAALVGGVATSLQGIYGPDTATGHVILVVLAVATAVAVYQVPNAKDKVDVIETPLV